MALHVETPLIESIPLGRASGRRVFLKMESLQPAGSFKLRGIGRLCEEQAQKGARRFVAPSGGNAGYAAAWAARELGLDATVVVPETTSEEAKNAISTLGAEVLVHGANWNESNKLALSMAAGDPQSAYIHPFEDPIMWDGHGTIIDEACRQGSRPDAIVLSVGGGGLLCGVVAGMDRNGWGDVSLVAAETEGADCFSKALASGRVIELGAITSLATSLGAKAVTPKALELARTHTIRSFVGSDRSAVRACSRFLNDHRVLVEPACGIALAAVYENSQVLGGAERILVIVCGGIGISLAKLASLEKSVA
ncbi:MAG: pyridoxal-phosphate dependent enzyme [Thermovirgaceae bacterium]|nr:pyridoxal-phosphate dependent enzyme [Thermovirgaceae bacterium]